MPGRWEKSAVRCREGGLLVVDSRRRFEEVQDEELDAVLQSQEDVAGEGVYDELREGLEDGELTG